MEKTVQNEPIHNADDGELKIKRRSVIDKDGLFWGKGRSTGGGGGGGSHDADNSVDDREKLLFLSEGSFNGISSDESSHDDQNAVKQKFVLAYKSNLDKNLKAETLDAEI
ncbi:hypothetical protein Tco_1002396 [Tanacetum coccineum]|uniref:Uncharacterized protein n=1 Tax=Tanacetum coccineum TaxID=301880 RepID=A0ABQ5F7M0_9ASTR